MYQRMLLFEEQNGVRFDTVVVHDAEDLIHPEALSLIDREREHSTWCKCRCCLCQRPSGS